MTPSYMAPELFPSSMNSSPVQPSKASDIYAFGVLSYEVICSRPAWQNVSMSLLESVCNNFRPSFPQGVDEALEGLIKQCWHQLPPSRPQAAAVLEALNRFCKVMHQDDSVPELDGEAADLDVCENDLSLAPTHTESYQTQACDSLELLESPLESQGHCSSITQLKEIKSKLNIAQYKKFQLEHYSVAKM